jgi:hypothetical protein
MISFFSSKKVGGSTVNFDPGVRDDDSSSEFSEYDD